MRKEQYIALPEEYTRRELNARYREIPLKDTTSRLLRKYFNAMANLYGIIPLHKAKEIVFSLSPKLVTEDEFLAFAEIARHECEGYYILGGDELYTHDRAFKVDGVSCLHNDFEDARIAAYRIHKAVGFRETGTLDRIIHLELTREDYLKGISVCCDK